MGYIIECTNPQCDYSTVLTSGMQYAYPMIYFETMREARSGNGSEIHHQFLMEHPDGVINVVNKMYRCKECGRLDSEMVLDMYVPKEGATKRSSVPNHDGEPYLDPDDLKSCYKLYKRYPHYCALCNGKMRVIRKIEPETEKCPYCGDALKVNMAMID